MRSLSSIAVAGVCALLLLATGAQAQTIRTISVGVRPWGVALDPDGVMYVTNEISGSVSAIEETTGQVIATIPVGHLPQGIAVDPATNRIFVANYGSDSVSVISGTSNTVITTLTNVGNGPNTVAYFQRGHEMWVGNLMSSDVDRILDPPTGHIGIASTSHLPNADIHDLAVGAISNTLFVSDYNRNYVSALDAYTGNSFRTIGGGRGQDGLATFPVGPLQGFAVADSAQPYGIFIYHGFTYNTNVWLNAPPTFLAATGNDIYASIEGTSGHNGSIDVIDLQGHIVGTYAAQQDPEGIAVDGYRNYVVAANMGSDSVTLVHF